MKHLIDSASKALAIALCVGLGTGAQADPTAAPVQAPQRQSLDPRPNVLVWLIDDVGFGQLSTFGGLVDTPNIDRVARLGLRYDNYHTAPICSASRAALLTGRNPHSVNNGGHANVTIPVPGYSGRVPADAGTIAENLRQAGYATFQVGKWDHLPPALASSSGPFTYWPLGQGFERAYAFLNYDTDNFTPTLVRDNSPVTTPSSPGYHISADFADQAIQMINSRDGGARRPFFLYWASGAAHAPLQAPQEWLDKFRGKFDAGWDKYRALVLKRQIAQGLVPRGTRLAPRPEGMPAWDQLSADQRKLYARQMEAFAACLAYTDHEFGRVLDNLEQRGELANTLVIITSDNGASAESGPDGLMNEAYVGRLEKPSVADNLKFYHAWGRPGTYPGYSYGWAVAGNTPYRYYKQTTFEGGIHVPLVVSWPQGIAARNGEIRADFVHVSDIAPTILDVARAGLAPTVNNVPQRPLEGVSFRSSFAASGNPRDGRPQYFELYGNRGFEWQGWAITTIHRRKTWDYTEKLTPFDIPWELYDLVSDPGQTTNLASKYPERVRQMAAMFMEQATRYHVFPQHDMIDGMGGASGTAIDRLIAQHHGTWRYVGPMSHINPAAAPPTALRPYRVTVRLDLPQEGTTGPIFARGGALGGYALYLENGRPTFVVRDLQGNVTKVTADRQLPPGNQELVLAVSGAPKSDRDGPFRVKIMSGPSVLADQAINAVIASGYNSDSFDIGTDQGSPVMPGYPAGRPLGVRNLDVTFVFDLPAKP